MPVKWWKAQDTFTATLKDGSEVFVAKGELKEDGHELVRRDQAGAGVLFRPLDLPEAEAPKSEPKAEPKAAPVKAAGGKGP
jgi:hypothetical protein